MARTTEELALEVLVEGFRTFNRRMDQMDRNVDKLGDSWEKNNKGSEKFSRLTSGLKAGILAIGAAAVGAAVGLGAMLKTGIEDAIAFESAFAGVIKTVDGVVNEFGILTSDGIALREELRGLATEIPVAFEEIAGIAELGGQLGVARDDIADFTETIAAMAVSTDLSSEAAATALAQIGNVMQSDQEELDRFASAVVALGNNMATTESSIVNFSQRIAGAGAIAGLTEGDIAGIGAAFASVGVEAEAGGTAVQKVLLGINSAVVTGGEDLETFAAVAGTTAEDFADQWEQDAGAAFTSFVEGLGSLGDDAIFALEELGLQDQRLIRSFLSLANAGDLLGESITLSNDAFAENTALAEEAERRYETTESQIQILKNTWREISATLGEAFLPVFRSVLASMQTFLEEHGPRIGEVAENIAMFFGERIPEATGFLVTFWNEQLIPMFDTAREYIEGNVVPVLETLASWFKQALPVAIGILTDYWDVYLLPIINALVALYNEHLQPVLADLWVWLQETIPPSITAISELWETIFKPALEVVATFLAETLIPILGDLVSFVIDHVITSVENTIEVYETLKTAFETVWEFTEKYLIPIFEALWEVIDASVLFASEALTALWENKLLPVLEDVWEIIKRDVIPVLEDLWEQFKEFVNPAVEIFNGLVNSAKEGIGLLESGVSSVIGWLEDLADSIRNMEIPEWLKPGSPPPIYYAIMDMGRAIRQVSTMDLPQLNRQLSALPALSMTGSVSAPSLQGGGSASNVSTSYTDARQFNLTTQSTTRPGGLALEFSAMELSTR